MILPIYELQPVCKTISQAIDSSELSILTETLELKTEGSYLEMNITNKEYYTRFKINLNEHVDFHATVNASTFLKLIALTTTETVELNVDKNNLLVKGNGTYKIPLIYEGESLLELPEINIDNVTATFDMPLEVLDSIRIYNAQELQKGTISRPVQKMFYVDENGCITFTSGACVNTFTLPQPVKILLPERIVKLFSLLKEDQIKVTLGQDSLNEDMVQTKVRFESKDLTITVILANDDSMLNAVPAKAIRDRATGDYPYSVTINTRDLLDACKRIGLFSSGSSSKKNDNAFCILTLGPEAVQVSDTSKENKESVYYTNTESKITDPYEAMINLNDLQITLDNAVTSHLTICFGDGQAFVVKRGNIEIVVPESKLM